MLLFLAIILKAVNNESYNNPYILIGKISKRSFRRRFTINATTHTFLERSFRDLSKNVPYSADYNTRVHYLENRDPLNKIDIQIGHPGTLQRIRKSMEKNLIYLI